MTSLGGLQSARTPGTDRDDVGALSGGLVAVGFGLVFVVVNSGGLPGHWTPVLRGLGVIASVGLAVLLVARFRRSGVAAATARRGPRRGPRRGLGRGYWLIVLVEVLALFGGLSVINRVLQAPRYAVAWVAVVVGVHFFALARVWRLTRFHALGAVMTALGLAGAGLGLAGADDATIRLVAGVGSGVALFATAATAGITAVPGGADGRGRGESRQTG